MTFTDEDIDELERILIRAKAEALSERNEAQRLWGAYGDRRGALGHQLARAERTIAAVERLRGLPDTLRPGQCVHADDPDAATVGLDWCRTHDSRWDLRNPQCDRGRKY